MSQHIKTQYLLYQDETAGIGDETFTPLTIKRSFQLTGFISGLSYAYSFDGSTEVLTAPYSATLALPSTLSISVWVKPDDLGSGNKYVATWWGSIGNRGWLIQVNQGNGAVLFTVSENGSSTEITTTSATCDLEEWNHIVVTFSGGALKIYINGVIDTNTTLTATSINQTTSQSLTIGGVAPSTASFVGQIDEVSIHDIVLDQSAVTDLYNSGVPAIVESSGHFSSAVGNWRCGDNNSTGTTDPDETSNANDATLVNMTADDNRVIVTGEVIDGAANVNIEVSNDGTNFGVLHTMTMTLTPTVNSDFYISDDPWKYVRGNITAISGADAQVTLIMGNEGY